jgi:hypothetical protein
VDLRRIWRHRRIAGSQPPCHYLDDPMKPRIAITAGDPAGIGPEIAIKAAADWRVRAV